MKPRSCLLKALFCQLDDTLVLVLDKCRDCSSKKGLRIVGILGYCTKLVPLPESPEKLRCFSLVLVSTMTRKLGKTLVDECRAQERFRTIKRVCLSKEDTVVPILFMCCFDSFNRNSGVVQQCWAFEQPRKVIWFS